MYNFFLYRSLTLSLSLAPALSIALGKLWPYWIFSTFFFRCRRLGRLFFFLAKCRRFLWAVYSPSFFRVAQMLISLFSLFPIFFLLFART